MYFAAGKPIIGTTAASEDFDVENGVDAIVVDDIERYVVAIKRLAENYKLRVSMSNNSAKIGSKFSSRNMGEKWLSLINKVLTKS